MSQSSDQDNIEDGLLKLDGFRESIDNLDYALIALLAERFKITKLVGELKSRLSLPPADHGREASQIARLRRLAVEMNLDPTFAEKVLTFIIAEVVRHHESTATRDTRRDGTNVAP